ncbi:uncharacterized protein ACO6RY_00817 [Pungitius sinensis]
MFRNNWPNPEFLGRVRQRLCSGYIISSSDVTADDSGPREPIRIGCTGQHLPELHGLTLTAGTTSATNAAMLPS